MPKKKSPVADEPNRDATPTDDVVVEQTLTSDPQLDSEQTTANIVAALVRSIADPNHRIVRRKVKVAGVWYQVEVSRP